jgi:tripartite-type tricarboxylate transporter receptor subunit TctC
MLIYRVLACSAAACLMLAGGGAIGQDYPAKPIRVVTTAAGGGNDIQIRAIGPVISASLNTPLVVDNRASTSVAAEQITKSPADGYNILYVGQTIWVAPLLQKVPYDMRDLAPISQVAKEFFIFAVHPSLPVKSIKDLIALAKSRPGELNYGSGSPGGPAHMAMELLKSMSGANIVWVPFKGSQPALTATIGGEVHITVANPAIVVPQMKTGRLRALAITSATPSELVADLATVAASGLPGYEMVLYAGAFAPAKTPRPIVSRLSQEIVRALNQSDVKQKFLGWSVETGGGTPEQFESVIKADVAKISKVIKDANIKIEQ